MAVPLVYAVLWSDTMIAMCALLIAGISDWADGYIACRFQLPTQLAAWLDPMADKVILNSTFLALAYSGLVPVWVAALLLFRDIVIVSGAYVWFKTHNGMAGQANKLGKLSTFLQFMVLAWCLVFPGLELGLSVFVLMVLVTLISGGLYVVLWGRQALKPDFVSPVLESDAHQSGHNELSQQHHRQARPAVTET